MNFREYDEFFWKELDNLVQDSNIVINRPKGTKHPRFPAFIYPVDYGYIEGTSTIDGGESTFGLVQNSPKKLNQFFVHLTH